MRVLIRTLPLDRGNYGGMLQAFALQTVMKQLGASPRTDATCWRTPQQLAKHHARRVKSRLQPRPQMMVEVSRARYRPVVSRFLNEHVDLVSLYDGLSRPRRSVIEDAQAFVVGSDQVWRKPYSQLGSFYLDFLDAADARPRVAYAASFGTDPRAEYSAADLALAGRQLRLFDAIGVRETAAVEQIAATWGLEAAHNLDPVMLLDPADYAALAPGRAFEHPELERQREGAAVFDYAYVLDGSPAIAQALDGLAAASSVPSVRLPLPAPRSVEEYRRDPAAYSVAHVTDWLRGFAHGRRVVTDSFHGTVLSLVHRRPFVAIVNWSRGADRFASLAQLPSLAPHFVELDQVAEGGAEFLESRLSQPIDWDAVGREVDAARAGSIAFLRESLSL
ncbi:polysaccharide pyruvyl transferase family protein [Demequina activiva]|uniref:Polysaccharide pyruvyl transferase domain-containing protein n=1 Tax=Demequina activiva TaxID=1582364 RepID=A0A919Q2Q7_9MICO|nr:polysaccharide pyruvyl transferase family protein [Demequina activiva]GIG53796.1 hypothetical protein Dac01nite_05480 [Demequina activiva]